MPPRTGRLFEGGTLSQRPIDYNLLREVFMKFLPRFVAALAVLALTFAPALVHAQDDAPPPPPPDASAPPPDGSAPPPDDGSAPPPPDAGGDQGTSFQTFYDQLGSQGNWVQTDNYGYVFQPNVSDPNWAPYTDGHWVYTDQGWMWASDEPWGWATYHYGRWANVDGTGWVWIPGYQWAPAWVSWRYGGGYCGWAPLPPETFIGAEYAQPGFAVGIGFHFGGDVDVSFNIGPGCYNFVQVGFLGDPNYRGHYLDRSRNFVVINNTTNITNININRSGANTGFRGVSVGGPRINEVNAHASQRIPTVRLAEAGAPGRSTLRGDTMSVYAPRVNAASIHQGRPARVSGTLASATLNRGDSITRPMQVTSSIQGREASPEAISAARVAAEVAPAHARVATERTEARTQFTQPLTSLKPVSAVRSTTAGVNAPHAATTTPRTESSSFTGESANGAVNRQRTETESRTPEENSVTPRKTTSSSEDQYTGGSSPVHRATTEPSSQTYRPQSPGGTVPHASGVPVREPAPASRGPAAGGNGNKGNGENNQQGR